METVGLKTEIDIGESAESLKELKAELKSLQSELSKTVEGSKEYENTLKAIANQKDTIDDLNESINAVTGGGKFQAIANLGGSIAGGFAAAQGALALFGSESKELEQSLLKVQAAMALSQGLKDLEGLGDSISNAGRAFKSMGGAALEALKGVRGAVLATGIGVLVAGVGALIAYWDDIKGFFDTMSQGRKEQEALNSTLEDYKKGVQEATKKVNDVKVAFDLARQGTISKKEALETYNKTLGATLGHAKDLNEAEKIFVEKSEAFIKAQGLRAQANALFNKAAEEQTKKITASQEDQTSWLDKTKNALLVITGQGTKGVTDQLKAQEEGVDKVKKKSEENSNLFTKLGEDLMKQASEIESQYKISTDNVVKSNEKIVESELDRIRRVREAREHEKEMNEQFNAELQEITDKERAEEEHRRQMELEGKQELEAAKIQASLDTYEKEKALAEKKASDDKLRRQATLQLTEQGLSLASAMIDVFAGKDEASQRKAFEINKKIQLAQATIEMFKGVQAAFTSSAASPFTAVFPGYPYVQAGLAAAFGLANIKKISDTKFEGGGGGGASVPSFSSPSGGASGPVLNNTPQQTSTQLNENGTVKQGETLKVIVTETDISNVQNGVNKIKAKAKIG